MSQKAPQRAKRVTLQQVADAAGVSRSAASFVLSGRTDQRIAQATAQKIQRIAQELGYRPNRAATTLRTGTSGTIALFSDFIGTTSHANAMVLGALSAVQNKGSLLFTVDTRGDAKIETRAIKEQLDRQVDGVIYASMFTREVILPSLLQHVPTVMLNCFDPKLPHAASVIPNEYDAGSQAAQLLLNAGHTRIAFAGQFPTGIYAGSQWPHWQPWALQERLRGIQDTLGNANLQIAQTYILQEWDIEDGRNIGKQITNDIAQQADPITAVICINDAVAFGVMQTLQQQEIRIPQDLSIVSFDGSPWSTATQPQLTSFLLPQEEMGKQAVALLEQYDTAGSYKVDMPCIQGATIAALAR